MVIRGLGVKRAIAGPEANRRKGVSCFRMKMYETETPQRTQQLPGGKRGNEKLVNAVTGSCWRVRQPFSVNSLMNDPLIIACAAFTADHPHGCLHLLGIIAGRNEHNKGFGNIVVSQKFAITTSATPRLSP